MKMKSILSVAAVATLALTLNSCAKDYTCNCKTSDGVIIGTAEYHAKQKDAQASCDALNTTYSTYTNLSCELN